MGTNQADNPLQAFAPLRSRLFGLAYRLLGTRADADDIVQETYIRWHQVDRDRVESAEAWLVTSATRLAIDRLRRLKTEREARAGSWVAAPEPPPDRRLDLADELSMAFVTILQRLAPDERRAFLLHDVFDVGYRHIASIIDKTESSCRQVVHRARERVRVERKRFDVNEAARSDLRERFLTAIDRWDCWGTPEPT